MVVADVECQYAARRQFAQVESDSFPGEQVHGDRIAAEGVQNDQVVACVLRAAQFEPRVAQHSLRLWRALAEEGEVARVRCDALDGRVDLVEGQRLAGLPVAGHGARSQADDSPPWFAQAASSI